jgi:hypothetical protein
VLFSLDDFDRFLNEPIPVYINASDLLEAQSDLATSLSLAEVAFNQHDWSWARSQFLSVARNKSAEPSARIDAANGLGKAGLCEAGRDVLDELNLEDEKVVLSAISALISCSQEERAVELCRNYLMRSDTEFLDRVEAAACLGRLYRKDLARSLIMEVLEKEKCGLSGRSRAAEILNEFEYKSDARTILFDLRNEVLQSPDLDCDDGLWLIEAMTSCSLYSSARLILDRIDRQGLIEEALDRYEQTRTMLEEPFLAD